MKKSARILGQEYGLTAQEMNFVLKEEGYLDGDPGNYFVTEKGEKYAKEQDYHRGTGGYAHYNRYWTTRSWDDGITDELDISDDRKKEIRAAISLAKQKVSTQEDVDLEADNSYENEYLDAADDNDEEDSLVAAVAMLLVAVSAYGIYRAAPYIKRWWKDKVVPSFKQCQ